MCGRVYRAGWSNPTPSALLPGMDTGLLSRGDKDTKMTSSLSPGWAMRLLGELFRLRCGAGSLQGTVLRGTPWAGGHSLPPSWPMERWGVPSPIAGVVRTSVTAGEAGMARPEGVWPLWGKQTSLFNVGAIRLLAHHSVMMLSWSGHLPHPGPMQVHSLVLLSWHVPVSMLDLGSPCHPGSSPVNLRPLWVSAGLSILSPGEFRGTFDLLGLSFPGSWWETLVQGLEPVSSLFPSPRVQAQTPFLIAVLRPCPPAHADLLHPW